MLSFRPCYSLVHRRACLVICDLISLVQVAERLDLPSVIRYGLLALI